MKAGLLAAAALLSVAVPCHAQDKATVDSLIKQGYDVVGVIPSNAGPGILLESDDGLMLCFVAEKPDSPVVATQYCKPVH
ncbi:MAG: hypothetical protein J0H34_00690 [Rhizobiales bacterium]|nr:hypothetical protein [Hyphomicrobiales bacterium]